jgi:hypothetical protein
LEGVLFLVICSDIIGDSLTARDTAAHQARQRASHAYLIARL